MAPNRASARVSRGRSRWGALALLLILASGSANADDKAPELSFSANEVSGDTRLGELVLRGNVLVTYERFRLESPDLRLSRTPRGVEVRGPGNVVFCPCPDPPLAIRFESVLVAPPADLVLRQPRLLLGGTTVAALPWFWLRAPSRVGLLPPLVAWRGADGLLLGDGVHLPWRREGGFDELDVTAAAYLRGGVELTAKLRTSYSTTKLRWDHRGDDLVAADSIGALPIDERSGVAWSVDAIRGPRALRGTIRLEEAALPYDRAAMETTLRPASAIVGFGARAMAPRGGESLTSGTVWGPRGTFAMSGALGGVGSWDESATLTVLSDSASRSTNLARAEGGIELDARPGPLLLRVNGTHAITTADTAQDAGLDGMAVGQLHVGLPLLRVYPDGDEAPLAHTIEPDLETSYAYLATSGDYWNAAGRPVAMMDGSVVTATAGGRTSWGRLYGRSGATIEGAVGTVGRERAFTPVARWRTAWSSRHLGMSGEGALLGGSARGQGQVTTGRVRVGDIDGAHVSLRVAGRSAVEPILARALTTARAGEREVSGGWLATEGWSGGGEIGTRLGSSVSARAGADGDLTAKTLLGVRGSVGYAHPCKCLAVDAFAGHRLGREGVDIWIAIDLAPP